MDGPALKRRRISPPNSAAGAESGNATPQSAEPPNSRPRRPSIASPTKASLARHRQQILERRRSASPSKPTNSRPTSMPGADQLKPATTARNASPSDPRGEEDDTTHRSIVVPGSSQFVRRTGGSWAAAPRGSPATPNPRPLPPPAPEGEDEFTSFFGRRSRRSPNTGIPISHPEPELPPSAPDAVPTSPRGIHSSQSRWRARSKSKGFPPKPMARRPGGDTDGKSGLPMRSLAQAEAYDANAHAGSLDDRANPDRQVLAYDQNADKKKDRDALLKEITKLKRDLRIASKENERIRLMQTSSRILSSTDEDGVLDVVRRCLIDSESNDLPPQSHRLMKAALNPMGLLPFGRMTPVVVSPEGDENMADIKSHHPVQMTAEEELPYLQLFSPFSVTSSIAVLPSVPDHSLRQRRLITFRSRDAPGLFTSKVEMVVNAMDLIILELNVVALEPAAKAELGPFINKICRGDCNRSMQRNIGILSWAMGEWHRAAIQRARLWSQLGRELASKEALQRVTTAMRRRRPQRRKDDEPGSQVDTQGISCKMATLIQFIGQQSFELSIPATNQSSSVRLEWKIEFDWVGEAQSKVTVLVGVPGKWRKADQRGVLGKLPGLFKDLVDGGEDSAAAAKTIVALVAGERPANDAVDDD